MVVVKMGEQDNVGWAFLQQPWGGIPSMALQKQNAIPQDGIGQNPDLADVQQYSGMSNIVYLSQ